MRGEYNAGHAGAVRYVELPPRARRIPVRAAGFNVGAGTTSACAENTIEFELTDFLPGNYLRVRGEYMADQDNQTVNKELPPRARRILENLTAAGILVGTTSACAENTEHKPEIYDVVRNYLRVSGEYRVFSSSNVKVSELPPRAQRIRQPSSLLSLSSGTTSACAENTGWMLGRNCSRWNYLRVRGEYIYTIAGVFFGMELPPRARRILFAG